ncbi:MAG: hypothetical protein ACTSRZ_10945 [Promethearchaeota archaeon]
MNKERIRQMLDSTIKNAEECANSDNNLWDAGMYYFTAIMYSYFLKKDFDTSVKQFEEQLKTVQKSFFNKIGKAWEVHARNQLDVLEKIANEAPDPNEDSKAATSIYFEVLEKSLYFGDFFLGIKYMKKILKINPKFDYFAFNLFLSSFMETYMKDGT